MTAKINFNNLAEEALLEDRFGDDLTSERLELFFKLKGTDPEFNQSFVVVAKADGVASGRAWVEAVASVSNLEIQPRFEEGQVFRKGDLLAQGRGPWRRVLAVERVLLNQLQLASGVATHTRRLVDVLEKHWVAQSFDPSLKPKILHTRKTPAMLRQLMVQAVVAGGGSVHRMSLADTILFKDNHKLLCERKKLKFEDLVKFTVQLDPKAQIEVESQDELGVVLGAGATRVLLDNFSPTAIRMALVWLEQGPWKNRGVEVEVSGGIREESFADFLIPGVHRISLGSLTHHIKSIDLSLDWVG